MKNALVTGSSKGLGKAIAKALAEAGYTPWLSARGKDTLLETAKEIEEQTGVKPVCHTVDYADQTSVAGYLTEISNVKFEVLVNNAGIYVPDRLDKNPDLNTQMRVNFSAAYQITQSLLPRFVDQQKGHIFNICSVVNRQPRIDAASYTISKFALYGYHQLLHATLKPHKVKVTAFFPASINTASWDGIEAPKHEFVQPEDIAALLITTLHMQSGTVPSEIDLNCINPDF